jgi:glutamate-ammonia-ligase adenylyltransferase
MAANQPLRRDLIPLADRLAQRLGDERMAGLAARVVAERAPDERLALAFLLKLAEQSAPKLRSVLGEPALAGDLIFCLGASELIATELAVMPSGWCESFRAAREATAASILAPMNCELPAKFERASLGASLREFKRRHFLRIAIADVLGRLSVGETMTLMSRLADECVRGALAGASALMTERAREAGRFCVVAMGKLGAGELNLSSDLDLLYLFDAPDQTAAQLAAARLGELLTELLGENCFRIDLRLRPGGQSGTLVPSLEAAISFYQSFGQTWERAALLRARPIAGSIALGRRLMAELERFIYRRFLDFDTLSQLRMMKHQIEDELPAPEMVESNIKLGRGGIRELEFVTQALTLVYGGRDPRLRDPQTVIALERLEALGYLESSRARQLRAAYLFLRDVEHKLQVVDGLQTHTLPAEGAAIRALAARMGFGKSPQAVARLSAALGQHRGLVNAVFREMLAADDEYADHRASAGAHAAWRAALDPKESAPQLQQLGFARPAESAGHLHLLACGPGRATASARRHELLERLGPRLLDEIVQLPDPDLALLNLSSFMAAVGARTSFLSLLQSHPATRAVLLRLFASSSYLSTIFIRHPDLLDTLVRSDLAKLRRSAFELNQELAGMIGAAPDFEARLDALRIFRHQEFLRIAIADLAGKFELEQLQAELTVLAEAVLRQALLIAREETVARHPVPASMALCTVAMGRLGSGEMSYNSDLDLIFVYRDADESAEGGRVGASRIVQKLIAVLEARTREGYVYKLDLRLRPSGNAGPLVTSLDSFIEYHRGSSAVWERQALIRARVVAGDEELGAQVEAARREFVFSRGLDATGVAEIAAMRQRMELEIGTEDKSRLNIKQGRGGLVDAEFAGQMLALRHGWRHRELRHRATLDLLRSAERCGIIAGADCERLGDHYRFLSMLENRLRIDTDQAAWALPTDPAILTPIARRMGFVGADGARRLLAEVQRRRAEARAIFEQIFAAEQSGADDPPR